MLAINSFNTKKIITTVGPEEQVTLKAVFYVFCRLCRITWAASLKSSYKTFQALFTLPSPSKLEDEGAKVRFYPLT